MAKPVKTPAGNWRMKVERVGYQVQTKTFKTQLAAEQWGRSVETGIDKGVRSLDVKAAKGKTVADLFDRYIAACETVYPNGEREIKVGKSSINAAKRVRATANFLGRKLNQIQPMDITEWKLARLKKVKPTSVDRELTAISSVFRQAMEVWYEPIAFNPVIRGMRPKYDKTVRDVEWREDQIEAVCKVLGYEEGVFPAQKPHFLKNKSRHEIVGITSFAKPASVAYAFLFALETSMRQGEIGRLTVADYNSQDGFVQVHKSKNGTKRKVSLNTRASELIDVLCQGMPPKHRIFHYTGGTISCYFTQARQEAGIHGLTFHDSRHEAITRMVPQFTNIAELAGQTGHKKLQSLMIYYNPKQKTIRSRLLEHDQKMAFQKNGGQLRSVA